MNFIGIREYSGDQLLFNSGRLVLNSKDDNIFLITKKDTVISAGGSLHINVGPENNPDKNNNMMIVNAPKIKLGLGEDHPLVKGDTLANLLKEMVDILDSVGTQLQSATAVGVGVSGLPAVNAAGVTLSARLKVMKSKIDQIKSEISYTS